MNFKLKKIDAIIIAALLIIAGLVLFNVGYISFNDKPKDDTQPDEIINDTSLPPPPPIPPESLIPGYMKAVTPEDEGVHFDKIRICREWWYFSAVFNDENSELNGWTVAVSFNHMARSDLLGTTRPDLLVVTLHGPNGEEYGGMINKKRGFGILQQPTLQAKSPGVSVTFEDSWAEGRAPEWHVHAEDKDIDKSHEIVIDLEYFASGEPLWTIGDKAFDKSESNIASYMFTGCNVSGTVQIDGKRYTVEGIGHHEHSWSPRIVNRGSINGWDWFHMVLDNGWSIYLSNYYPTPQFLSTMTTKINQFGSLVITTDQGKTLTALDSMDLKIVKSDENIFPFVKMPSDFKVASHPGVLQPLLMTYNMQLDLDIEAENTYEHLWRFPTYVGMKVGRFTISGKIAWADDDGNHEMELDGIGNMWSMRALL